MLYSSITAAAVTGSWVLYNYCEPLSADVVHCSSDEVSPGNRPSAELSQMYYLFIIKLQHSTQISKKYTSKHVKYYKKYIQSTNSYDFINQEVQLCLSTKANSIFFCQDAYVKNSYYGLISFAKPTQQCYYNYLSLSK